MPGNDPENSKGFQNSVSGTRGRHQYRHTSFYCALFYCASQMLSFFGGREFGFLSFLFLVCFFLQIGGKTLHQQQYYNLLYYETRFIAMVWNWTSVSLTCACVQLKYQYFLSSYLGWWCKNLGITQHPFLYRLIKAKQLCLVENSIFKCTY